MSLHVAERLVAAGMSEAEAAKKSELFAKLEQGLSVPGGAEVMRWFVPGRIEVLGKHTDYAGGRSLSQRIHDMLFVDPVEDEEANPHA